MYQNKRGLSFFVCLCLVCSFRSAAKQEMPAKTKKLLEEEIVYIILGEPNDVQLFESHDQVYPAASVALIVKRLRERK